MRSRFMVPTTGTDSWRALLADPVKHWRRGYSARALAYCWEDAGGLPKDVRAALASSDSAALQHAEMLLGIPEHQVPLPGGARPSQNDIWVLAQGADELISIAVEGKVSEAFGPTVEDWLNNASKGKRERLRFLRECLGLGELPGATRYQLLHRTASAVIEARRFCASHAVLLVHSFSPGSLGLEDYAAFAGLYGVEVEPGATHQLARLDGVTLHAAWVMGDEKHLSA